jgi:hypothetical protein
MQSVLLLAAFLSGSASVSPHPVTLHAADRDGGVELKVIGLSAKPMHARYTLEVRSGSSNNHSVQSGNAVLEPNRQVSLIQLKLGGTGAIGWSARLRVEPAEGEGYEELLAAEARE